MKDNTVVVDKSTSPAEIRFAPVFNVAVAFIDRHVEEGRAKSVALRTEQGDVTYGQLAEGVDRCGNALKALGLRAGDRALMAVYDSPMFFHAFWGAIKAGIIPIPVNTLLKSNEYQFLIKDAEVRAFLYSPPLADRVIPAVEAAAGESCRAVAVSGPNSLEQQMAGAEASLAPAATTEDTECFWLYSSGSTGNPKGVVHVHRDMVITSERYGQGIAGIRDTDTVYCASKLFFSYGFGGGMTFPLWAGSSIVLREEMSTADLTFDVIEKHRPSVFFGVPTLYAQQIHLSDSRRPDMSSVRAALSAGEALPAHVFEQARDRSGFSILDGIGSTEVLHIFVSNRHDDIKPGTSGRVVPGYEVRIVGEDGEPLPPGEIGTLHVKGESNAQMYWKNPEKTAKTMLGDWLNTGDMYYVDDEGHYVNAGRGDDMLKVGGMWCSPIDIESCLIRHPEVREAAVIGRSDDDGLVKPAAYIVVKNPSVDQGEISKNLQEFCKSELAGYKYPELYAFGLFFCYNGRAA